MRLLLAPILALALGCNQTPAETTPAEPPAPALPNAPPLPAPRGPSLYDLELELTDQDGRQLSLRSFRGRPLILTMFYGTCPYACPMLISDVKRALARADPAARQQFQVLLVSLDPERDTPAAMKELANVHEIDLPAWRLTRSSGGTERELAAVLGIKYKKLENGAIQHTSVISVLDRRGVVRHRRDGTPEGAHQALVSAIDAVAAERGPEG